MNKYYLFTELTGTNSELKKSLAVDLLVNAAGVKTRFGRPRTAGRLVSNESMIRKTLHLWSHPIIFTVLFIPHVEKPPPQNLKDCCL